MPKDYARYPYQSKPTLMKKGWRERLAFIIVVGALIIIPLGAFCFYQSTLKEHNFSFNQLVAQVKVWLQHKNNTAATRVLSPPEKDIKKTPEVHFDFYTELPQMKVKLAENSPAALPLKYFLDLGRYKDEATAIDRRVSLLLVGFDVNIIKYNKKGQTEFHLQQGPFTTIVQAQAAQQKLKKKDIDSLVRKSNAGGLPAE